MRSCSATQDEQGKETYPVGGIYVSICLHQHLHNLVVVDSVVEGRLTSLQSRAGTEHERSCQHTKLRMIIHSYSATKYAQAKKA